MPREIRVPRLGWSMEEGIFVRWLKAEGEIVRAGEPLFELEGEKALQEIEAVDSGILRILPAAPAEGAVVAVGALLGYLVAEGEDFSIDEVAAETIAVPPAEYEQGRVIEINRTPREVTEGAAPASTPRARRVAAELGVDWKGLRGSGRGGRIRECDVRQVAGAGAGAAGTRPTSLTNRRRVIAERMAASARQTAPVTLTTRCEATSLVSYRRRFQTAGGTVPTYSDIVAKLAALVLLKHRHMAGRFTGELLELLELPPDDGLHIGIAVDTDEGLLVPVLRDVARRLLSDIAQQSQQLVEQARAGRLAAGDMQGGVFTITNLGAFGIDAFTPIINLPEVAILGLGAIRREPIVRPDGQIVAAEMITLSLTFDHRAIDGAPAARFLQALVRAIENPPADLG